jgi:hypothetical protein
VHVPPERSQVDVRRLLEVSVGGKGAKEVAVRALRLVGAAKQLALLLDRGPRESVRIDGGGQQTPPLPDVARLVGWTLGELGPSAPALVVVVRPAAAAARH